jgi:hypothetical protein
MTDFKPNKTEALDKILYVYALFMSFILSIAGNILYDLFIESMSYMFKIFIVGIAFSWTVCLFKLVNNFYLKPFKNSKE